jgi:coiled-coil domain-containing protein 12
MKSSPIKNHFYKNKKVLVLSLLAPTTMSKSATLSRKERLAKIRAAKAAKDGASSSSSTGSKKRARPQDTPPSSNNTDTNHPTEPTDNKNIKFRNYDPGTRLKAQKLDHAQPPSIAASAKVSEAVAIAGAPRNPDAPIVVVQKKIDWDLKRDIEPQLKILERRTRIAVRELLKQQMQGGAQ